MYPAEAIAYIFFQSSMLVQINLVSNILLNCYIEFQLVITGFIILKQLNIRRYHLTGELQSERNYYFALAN